ncbi:2-dehydro-3-deoxygluconokinase [Leucobacter sp. UCD-THU]|jgi:2-dehydro-3-deoxygluconokinase|uniref:Sugar kinase n=1 Tax=Leucobacter muris TaxID=1935379 RepID=A0ABX5QIM3_9MICO|nr:MULTISPECIES: sugar kinase [Leucobacter]EYT54575.1 2-dehydro-3-deoxygluconokinase [Leucobacter sp. UCD-THU]QAB18951.1 sugar kinase [Leucobacter muris]
MPDIISIGEPLVEFNAESLGGPRVGSLYSIGFGGDSSNFAVAVSRLGGSSGYMTRVGADHFGALLQDLWHEERVDASRVITDERHPTGLYFILRHGGRSEFVYRRADSAASHLEPSDLPEGMIEEAKLLHVTGITQAISQSACETVFAAIERARAAQVTVSYDPNIRPAIWPLQTARAIVRYTIPQCDVVLPNLDEGRLLTGYEDPRAITQELLELGAPLVVLKLGSSGSVIATPDDYYSVPARPVLAKDPTGAGDCFDAAFAVAITEGKDPVDAAIFATAAASRVVQGLGAVAPIPTRSAVLEDVSELRAEVHPRAS